MVDAIFGDRRLAAVYDAFDAGRGDLDAYMAIIEEFGAARVLDIGCGTGTLALRLARAGLTVTGVDPAEASIEVARAKQDADKVTWVHGFAAPAFGADLAVMAGNAAQALLTDEDWDRLLTGVFAALRPGGHFVFETRRPDRRIWEQWQAGRDVEVREVPGAGRVERHFAVTEVRPPFVSFHYTYHFAADGVTLGSGSTLWFREREDLEKTLLRYAFTTLDVREAPDRPGLEMVFITQRSA